MFRILKFIQKRATAKDDVAGGLAKVIRDLFAYELCAGGLNIDRNQRKKKSLIDFLRCLREMLEKTTTKEHLQSPFVEAGMIDEESKIFPTFDGLISTCKKWVSSSKDAGVSMATKEHCKDQFFQLAQIHREVGQISYADMHSVGIPRG